MVRPGRAFAAATVLLLVVLVGCTAKGRSGVASIEPRLDPATSTGAPGDLEFRSIALLGVDGTELAFPDPGKAVTAEGDGHASCPPGLIVAILGPATGIVGSLGKPIMDAAALAVSRFAAANPDCQVQSRQFDTQSADVQTLATARALLADTSVIGVIGPVYSHEMSLVGDDLDAAGLVVATPSATAPELTRAGWSNVFRGTANDDQLVAAGANYLRKRLGYTGICVVGQDDGEDDAAVDAIQRTLGEASIPGCRLTIGNDPHLADEVRAIADVRPQAVYFAGYPGQAAALLDQLRADGVDATFMASPAAFDEEFLTDAGDAGRGVLLVRDASPATPELAAGLEGSPGRPTALYTVESYEIASIMTRGIAAGAHDRAALRQYFRGFSGSGSFRHYAWADNGELRTPEVQLYEVG